MKIKYQWFLGGRVMFWVSIILFTVMVLGFVVTYVIDPTSKIYMSEQSIDPTSIQTMSEKYVECMGIEIDAPIEYRFVRYQDDDPDKIVLGTFHKWNDTYYISISVDLYKTTSLNSTIIHETRHMIVRYLKDENIIDLEKYTEEIAQEKNEYYNNMFNGGVYLLRESQKENKND